MQLRAGIHLFSNRFTRDGAGGKFSCYRGNSSSLDSSKRVNKGEIPVQVRKSNRTDLLLTVFCILLALDIASRWFGASPVEATRLEGRERDAALDTLSVATNAMAQANLALAESIAFLNTELHGLKLGDLADSQEKLSESQKGLGDAAKLLSESFTRLSDTLKAKEVEE